MRVHRDFANISANILHVYSLERPYKIRFSNDKIIIVPKVILVINLLYNPHKEIWFICCINKRKNPKNDLRERCTKCKSLFPQFFEIAWLPAEALRIFPCALAAQRKNCSSPSRRAKKILIFLHIHLVNSEIKRST